MTDPRDALLAEAARLLAVIAAPGPETARQVRAWLARYEAERAGRGDAIAEAEQRGAERERAACLAIARGAVETYGEVAEQLELAGDIRRAHEENQRSMVAEVIAGAIAARTAPATPGKGDGE